MKLLLYTESLELNGIGRAFCLWRLAQLAGWTATVYAPIGDMVWKPLRGSDFEAQCRKIPEDRELAEIAEGYDLLIALKPLPQTLGAAIKACSASNTPLLLDIDNPDFEWSTSSRDRLKRCAKWVLKRPKMKTMQAIKPAISGIPKIVSNPWLQAKYGGTIIPHVREDNGFGREHVAGHEPMIVFVGTNRPHKGVGLLRTAISELRKEGVCYEFTITDVAPRNSKAWEHWVGETSFEEGLALAAEADVVVLPSTSFAEGQLPAKLMDAMLAGRAVIVSDTSPLPWAVGESGFVFASGSVTSLKAALRKVHDHSVRRIFGAKARRDALGRYLETEYVGDFTRACEEAIDSQEWPRLIPSLDFWVPEA